ncbi:hypothetical protein F4810DRAFT_482323 [Camillea tinctor]|nr:hypothetical protein F4810DRAFT_482323 [Camillea tinctor]
MASIPCPKVPGNSQVTVNETDHATNQKGTSAEMNDLKVDFNLWHPMTDLASFGRSLYAASAIYHSTHTKTLPIYMLEGVARTRQQRYIRAFYTQPTDRTLTDPMSEHSTFDTSFPDMSFISTPDLSFETTFVSDSFMVLGSPTGSEDSGPEVSTTPLPIAHAIALSVLQPDTESESETESSSSSLNPLAESFKPTQQKQQKQPKPRRVVSLPSTLTSSERSTTYLGDPSDPLNNSADIPESESVGLWIDRLPPTCTPADILDRIRGCGKIFALHINEPKHGISTSAAKISFWSVEGKERFLCQGFAFPFPGPRPPRVTHSVIRVPAVPSSNARSSRVIHFAGPAAVVNQDYLDALFAEHLSWTVERVIDHGTKESCKGKGKAVEKCGERAWLEYRFSSYRAQASRVWQLLNSIKRGGEDVPRIGEGERDILKQVDL